MANSTELRIYKPSGSNGSAVKFQKRVDKKNYDSLMAFAEFANQTGKSEDGFARFDWRGEDNPNSKAITVKLSELDIARLLLVLRGEVDSMDLFHDPGKSYEESDNTKRSTVIKFSKGDRGFMFNVSNKVGTDLKKVNLAVSWEEGVLLESWSNVFLSQFYV
jgi:hypothetical protein